MLSVTGDLVNQKSPIPAKPWDKIITAVMHLRIIHALMFHLRNVHAHKDSEYTVVLSYATYKGKLLSRKIVK